VPAVEAAVKEPERAGQEFAATAIVKREDGLLELKRIEAPLPVDQVLAAVVPLPQPVRAPEPQAPVAPLAQVAMLEIRNGNGVTGMAKGLKLKMDDPGLKVVRLTNEKGFNVRQTRVEYQAGFRGAAERLAQRFENASVVEVDNCKKSDMRLVIGRDIARPNFALRPIAPPTSLLADASKPDAGS
jgi:hypothetical protein